MKTYNRIYVLVLNVILAGTVASAAAELAQQSSGDFVKDVVYNELQDRSKQSFWRYRVEKRLGQHTLLEYQIETVDGPVHRVLANIDSPLTDVQRREEQARVAELERDPSVQAGLKRKHEEDEQKLERLMKLMPEAFLFDNDGVEQGLTKLKFRPNPAYNPATYEAKVFHGLAGTVWVDPRQKRLAHVSATIVDRIDFGLGLLGHIEKGGTFELKRQQVSATHWKTSLVDVHMSGKFIFFKTISRDQREVRSEFNSVPTDTTMLQANQMLARLPGPH